MLERSRGEGWVWGISSAGFGNDRNVFCSWETSYTKTPAVTLMKFREDAIFNFT